MADTRAFAPVLVRLRACWEARAKRRVCLTLHHWGLLKPLSFVQWLVTLVESGHGTLVTLAERLRS